MAHGALREPAPAARYTVERYFALAAEGVLSADDRVELLEGVIVAMSPQSPEHASSVWRAADALRAAVGTRAAVRSQLPLTTGPRSVPEPDVALVIGHGRDYDHVHPTTALLVVEVADSSLVQDRLTKAPIYAAAGVPEYWIVNLRDERVEVFRGADVAAGRYATTTVVGRGGEIEVGALPGARVRVDDLLPGSP